MLSFPSRQPCQWTLLFGRQVGRANVNIYENGIKKLTNFRLCCVDVWSERESSAAAGKPPMDCRLCGVGWGSERKCPAPAAVHHLLVSHRSAPKLDCAWVRPIRGGAVLSVVTHPPPSLPSNPLVERPHDIFVRFSVARYAKSCDRLVGRSEGRSGLSGCRFGRLGRLGRAPDHYLVANICVGRERPQNTFGNA